MELAKLLIVVTGDEWGSSDGHRTERQYSVCYEDRLDREFDQTGYKDNEGSQSSIRLKEQLVPLKD